MISGNKDVALFSKGDNVVIVGGTYDGMRGVCSDVTEKMVYIILEDSKKTVRVMKSNCRTNTSFGDALKEEKFGNCKENVNVDVLVTTVSQLLNEVKVLKEDIKNFKMENDDLKRQLRETTDVIKQEKNCGELRAGDVCEITGGKYKGMKGKCVTPCNVKAWIMLTTNKVVCVNMSNCKNVG
jgi:transcription antitermination factor NusG